MKSVNVVADPPLNLSDCLAFLNRLKLGFEITKIKEQLIHSFDSLSGWHGLRSLVCEGRSQQIYDVDIRYAWGKEIFQQHLFDYGWNIETLLYRQSLISAATRHKLIIYFCTDSTGLEVAQKTESVAERFALGQYWQTITHVYLRLPCSHPFSIPKIQYRKHSSTAIELLEPNPPQLSTKSDRLNEKLLFKPHSQRKDAGGLRTKGLYRHSTPEQPVISVITVVYNGEKYLEQTIQSVINQTYPNIEYIIIDGGSEDATLEIIKKYEASIDYWISEPDGGIYDAMNKGTIAATGSHTLHINADDLLFLPTSLDLKFEPVNYLRGQLMVLLEEEVLVKRIPRNPHSNRYVNMIRLPVFHQSFIGLKTNNSTFNSSYKIIGDNILVSQKITQEPIDVKSEVISIHRGGGVSAENIPIRQELWRALDKSNLPALLCLIRFEIYCRLREIAKKLRLVNLKRKYLN